MQHLTMGRVARVQRAYTDGVPTEHLPLDLERLKDLRLRAALSQRALAQKAGVAESTLRAIELGQRDARPITTQKLARALGVKPSQLMLNGNP
jgi:DNA-binding XRE family transcriptional regulator